MAPYFCQFYIHFIKRGAIGPFWWPLPSQIQSIPCICTCPQCHVCRCARIMQIHIPMIAEVKVLQRSNMLYVHHMHTLVCRVFKWNYEQQLYCHTLILTDIKFARTNVPLIIFGAYSVGVDRNSWKFDRMCMKGSTFLMWNFIMIYPLKRPHWESKKLLIMMIDYHFQ